ncbi:MAG: tRNA lysidine(34) synthetase TilS [Methyloversatilis sp.]|jgi:tRNA(Ile)-lysidine synthase|nr:tRNA lysidine(34) synthetase TilS [Methyloversatilis sp.]MBP6194044.1 tRNA lysidine(34) synthetase TilS [Methyloversatilis sp.]MBP9116962.1 tRNA lysidine(34) synthetase TilS [Methyloversatilis sp.]
MANSRSRQSPDLFSRLAQSLTGLFPARSRLLLGYSGGVDSTLLLHLLASVSAEHGWQIECAHVHHGLSPNADAWADACAAQCSALALPFTLLRVSIPANPPGGIECAARDARYAALHAHARTNAFDVLLTGHHADDQAETLLHNMVRGAGLLGLAGMPARKPCDAEHVASVRPLLAVSRAVLETCARERGLSWIEDESNADTRFARNYLRREVMPRLSARWPRTAETMAGLARRLAEAQSLLDELASVDAAALSLHVEWGTCFSLDGLTALDAARQRNLLRWLLRMHGARTPPNEAWLDEWRRQLCSARAKAECPVAHAGVAGFCHRGALWLMPDHVPPSPAVGNGGSPLAWGPGQLRFQPVIGRGLAPSALVAGNYSVRARAAGDRVQRGPGRPRAGVKQIAQESGLPPWLRDRAPILCADGIPVWMPGCEVSPPHAAAAGEPGLLPVWHPVTD